MEFDCNLVYANCTKYNRPGSEIVKLASRVTDRLAQAIKMVTEGDSHCAGGGGSSSNSVGPSFELDGIGGGSGSSSGGWGGGGPSSSNGAFVGVGQRSRQGSSSRRPANSSGRRDYDDEEDEDDDHGEEAIGMEVDDGEDEDIEEEAADGKLRGKRKRSPTARYIDEGGEWMGLVLLRQGFCFFGVGGVSVLSFCVFPSPTRHFRAEQS